MKKIFLGITSYKQHCGSHMVYFTVSEGILVHHISRIIMNGGCDTCIKYILTDAWKNVKDLLGDNFSVVNQYHYDMVVDAIENDKWDTLLENIFSGEN